MPTVMATCWVIEVSPVARPCSSSGRPEVAVTVKATMAVTCPKNPMNSAGIRTASADPVGAEEHQRQRRQALHGQAGGQDPRGCRSAR